MPHYDLTGLSSRSFEKLVQALATKVVAPGVTIFGDGPDGGREATYDGKMSYPSDAEAWDGYCVIQAKFLQRPRDSKSDGDWAVEELRKELAAYADPEKGRRTPDYYIFATNVVLTPVADTGSKDRAVAVFNEFRDRVPIRDFSTWDFDQISAYLDSHDGIRRAYAAWITPGDVLSAVLQWLKPSRADFGQVITNFMAKELRGDQFAKLEQAGHTGTDRVPLAPVFVDLHVADTSLSEPPEDRKLDQEYPRFAQQIVEAARERLDPQTTSRSRARAESIRGEADIPEPGRYVLIGGPGQGKTTIGQFLCQLFRAALLRDRPSDTLTPEAREALDGIVQSCASESLELPKARRFPLRVVLSEFAGALSNGAARESNKGTTLLTYLADRIASRTDREVSPDDFRAWLLQYPWLIILDGLDEVPASSNRSDVLSAIDDFWTDAAQCNADVLVVATTRPQGYGDDFSPKYYRHQYLVPLSPQRALHYAGRLAQAKFGENESEQQRVLTGLQTAARTEATARLMRSPLQVTIMHTLVEHGGTPPQDRWQLFHDYYETIYRREKQRLIPGAQLLQDRKPDIDRIHWRAALLLQMQNERASGTEVKLTTRQFEAIVEDRLNEEEFEGADRQEIKEGVMHAAANRLVFLVGIEEGRVGFEIPSLREFMAAEALCEEGDVRVASRLREIAPVSAWRNVFLFAAGRCFAKHLYVRDTIHTICVELNHAREDPVGEAIRAGSLLAMDLLEIGLDQRSPKYGLLLAQTSVELMDLPPSTLHKRLADVLRSRVERAFSEAITQRMGRADLPERLGAWATLIPLVSRKLAWAERAANAFWPTSADEQATILESIGPTGTGQWVSSKVATLLPQVNRVRARVYCRAERTIRSGAPQGTEWSRAALAGMEAPPPFGGLRQSHTLRLGQPLSELPIKLGIVPLESSRWRNPAILCNTRPSHSSWIPVIEGARFAATPSKEALAAALGAIGDGDCFDSSLRRVYYPWPLAACVRVCDTSAQLLALADRVANGELGDSPDWRAAERRWEERGICEDDIVYTTNDHWPFTSEIAARGFPFPSVCMYSVSGAPSDREPPLGALLAVHDLLPKSRIRGWVAGVIFVAIDAFGLGNLPSLRCMPAHRLRVLLSDLGLIWIGTRGLNFVRDCEPERSRFLEFANELGRRGRYYSDREGSLDAVRDLRTAYREDPTLDGILAIIAREIESRDDLSVGDLCVDPTTCVRPHLRRAAIIISAVQGIADGEQATRLAALTVDVSREDSEAVPRIMHIMRARNLYSETLDQFLLQLLRELPSYAAQDRANVLARLSDSFRRRRSKLSDPERWKKLGFRPALLDLLA